MAATNKRRIPTLSYSIAHSALVGSPRFRRLRPPLASVLAPVPSRKTKIRCGTPAAPPLTAQHCPAGFLSRAPLSGLPASYLQPTVAPVDTLGQRCSGRDDGERLLATVVVDQPHTMSPTAQSKDSPHCLKALGLGQKPSSVTARVKASCGRS